MTTYNNFSDRNRDTQDLVEKHIWRKLDYEQGAGAYLEVEGTGTRDYDVAVINVGFGFNLSDNTNAEVFVFSEGSDTNQKHALPTLPRDRQRQWKPDTGGVQNPIDPDKALEFNQKRAHLREDNIAIGNGGAIEVVGDTVYIRGDLVVAKDLVVGGVIQAKGGIFSEGRGVFNGDVSTPLIRAAADSDNNDTTDITLNIPDFEDV